MSSLVADGPKLHVSVRIQDCVLATLGGKAGPEGSLQSASALHLRASPRSQRPLSECGATSSRT